MFVNKDHWYDGWFYDRFVAPNQDKLFLQIKNLIEPRSTVIDVGCGTGRLAFTLADKCDKILGIDLSRRNIQRANLTLSKNPNSKIAFRHSDLKSIVSEEPAKFDYAVATYVIHEIAEEERMGFLEDISRLAKKIIIGDYVVPRTKILWSLVSELVELAAGKDHHRNFRTFVKSGGLTPLIERINLRLIKEIKHPYEMGHLVVVEVK